MYLSVKLVDNLFKDQLKQAMLESKIEFEQNKVKPNIYLLSQDYRLLISII